MLEGKSKPKYSWYSKSRNELYGFAIKPNPDPPTDGEIPWTKAAYNKLLGMLESQRDKIVASAKGALAGLANQLTGGLAEELVDWDILERDVMECLMPLNPESVNNDLGFAVNFEPTTGAKVYVTQQGIVMGNLTIRGTTGYYYTEDSGFLDNLSSFNFSGAVGSLLSGGQIDLTKTGLYQIHKMRRLFFTYSRIMQGWYLDHEPEETALSYKDWMKNGDVVMVWVNRKDGDTWIVEPESFNIDRSVSQPFLYEYTIRCRVLGDYTGPKPFDYLTIPNPMALIADAQEALFGLASGLGVQFGSINRNMQYQIVDFQQNIRDVVDVLQGPPVTGVITQRPTVGPDTDTLFSGANADAYAGGPPQEVKSAGAVTTADNQREYSAAEAQSLPAKTLLDGKDGLRYVVGKNGNVVPITPGLGTGTFRYQSGKPQLSAAALQIILQNGLDLIENLNDEADTVTEDQRLDYLLMAQQVGAILYARNGIADLLAWNHLYTGKKMADVAAEVNAVWGDTVLPYASATMATKPVIEGDTIFSIAQRYLGSASRYRELIAINKLLPPYVAPARASGVLGPGDLVLIPAIGSDADVIVEYDENPETLPALGNVPQNVPDCELGIDLQLDANDDLILNAQNDLSVVAGVPNMTQAIKMRMSTKLGDHPIDPFYGVPSAVGLKQSNTTFIVSEIDLSLLRDPRVQSVIRSTLVVDGDIMRYTAQVQVAGNELLKVKQPL